MWHSFWHFWWHCGWDTGSWYKAKGTLSLIERTLKCESSPQRVLCQKGFGGRQSQPVEHPGSMAVTPQTLSLQMPGPDLGTRMQPCAKQIPALMDTYAQQRGGLVTQLCPTLCDPMDCNPPGSSVHGILPAGILEWVAIAFSRESSLPRGGTLVFCVSGRFFTVWASREDNKPWIPSWRSG